MINMGVNVVVFGDSTLIDLREDTVTPETLAFGITAHSKNGNRITGSLVTQTYYYGAGEPSADLGADGDLYLVMG